MGLIVEKIVSIFLIMAVGFVANRAGVLPKEANGFLTNLLIKIITPCMIISSITSKELTDETFVATIETLALAMAFFILAALAGYLLGKLFHVGANDLGTYAFTFGSINSGFMGFPITLALFGADILYLMVIHNITLTIYLYSLGSIFLAMGSGSKKSFSIKSFFKSFLNINAIFSFVSIAMLFAGLHLPSALFETTELIGDATVPVSMLLVGMQLGDTNPLKMLAHGKMVAFSFIKMLLLPAVTFLAVNWLPIPDGVKLCMVFAAVFPAAVGAVPVVALEGKDALPSAEMVAFTTLISIVTIPASAAFLTEYFM